MQSPQKSSHSQSHHLTSVGRRTISGSWLDPQDHLVLQDQKVTRVTKVTKVTLVPLVLQDGQENQVSMVPLVFLEGRVTLGIQVFLEHLAKRVLLVHQALLVRLE